MIDKSSPPVQLKPEEPDNSLVPTKSNKQKIQNIISKLPYAIGVLAIVALLIVAFRPAPILVDVAEVRRGDVQVTVDEEGETRIRKRYVVATPVEGRLGRISLDEGDRVTQGEVIAQLDPLALNSEIAAAQARLRQWQAEKAGVATQRPKAEALSQAEARIRGAIAKQRESQARVAQAQASWSQAQRDHDRNQQLYADGVISRQRKEQAELDAISQQRAWEAAVKAVDNANTEVQAAEAALAILRAEQQDPDYLLDVYQARIATVQAELTKLTDDAQRTQITAPVDGYVLRVNVESSKYLEAGTPILELGNLQDLEIVVDLLSADAVKVKPGAIMFLEHWGGEATLTAKVRYVEPAAFTKVSALGVEEQRVNVIADFVNSSPTENLPQTGLGDRFRLETKTVVWSGKDVLRIPLSAIFRCESKAQSTLSNRWCTFVVENNQARRRQLEVSQRSNFEAVVERGLDEAETVILHPTSEIKPGTKVKIAR